MQVPENQSEAPALQVGDTVAIRGDRRLAMDGRCQYLPEQLVDGKYVKHTGHGGVWTGKVQKIQGDEALVSGCWRHAMSITGVLCCSTARSRCGI